MTRCIWQRSGNTEGKMKEKNVCKQYIYPNNNQTHSHVCWREGGNFRRNTNKYQRQQVGQRIESWADVTHDCIKIRDHKKTWRGGEGCATENGTVSVVNWFRLARSNNNQHAEAIPQHRSRCLVLSVPLRWTHKFSRLLISCRIFKVIIFYCIGSGS